MAPDHQKNGYIASKAPLNSVEKVAINSLLQTPPSPGQENPPSGGLGIRVTNGRHKTRTSKTTLCRLFHHDHFRLLKTREEHNGLSTEIISGIF